MVASGFAGLGYQIVWTQQAALWLGHEAAAVLAVITAFFGGLALGAWALGPRIERSARPERAYAACEILIALWSGVLALALAPVSGWVLATTGAQPTPAWQWSVAFGATFCLLLPATAAMGATLPAMARVLERLQGVGPSTAGLYACNTLGALLGVLAAAFWLVPGFGLTRTAAVCAALNGLCALGAWQLAPRSGQAAPNPAAATDKAASPARSLLATLAATGLLGIAYEVLVVRVLSQVTEATVYTYAALLAVYLVGTAAGAAAWQRRPSASAADRSAADLLQGRLLVLLAAACLTGAATLWAAEHIRDTVRAALGSGLLSALLTEGTLALAAFLLPTAVMGALFSEMCLRAQHQGLGFSRALAVNTLGAAVAPPLFGVLLVPLLGSKLSLLLVVAGYFGLAATRGSWTAPARAMVAAAMAGLVAVAIWAPPLAFVEVPDGGHIVSYQEGALAAVSVVEDASGVSRLRINNRQQEGSSHSQLSDARQALLPLLLHPAPRRVLFLGLGTGTTARAAAQDPGLQVEAVELLPEVVAAAAHFAAAQAEPGTEGLPQRLQVVTADARRHMRSRGPAYDVIISDNFHPARSGSGSLYTVEHFQAVQSRLAEGGLFCQWLPLHQLDRETLRSIVQAYLQVYPGAWAMLATNSLDTPVLGLLARRGGARFDAALLQQRLEAPTGLPRLADFGLIDRYALLGGFVAGPQALLHFAGDAAVNTDDHPVVAYTAPRITYAPDSQARDRLQALLGELQIAPEELLGNTPGGDFQRRLAAYWQARDLFLAAGRDVRPTADVTKMLEQVRAPLLAVLRTSPDFRPADEPLRRMAAALGRSDARAARALLDELDRIQGAAAASATP